MKRKNVRSGIRTTTGETDYDLNAAPETAHGRPSLHSPRYVILLCWLQLLCEMKGEKCQKWDSNSRREKPISTWTQHLRPPMIDHPDILRDMLFYFVDYSYCVKWKGKNVRSGIRTHAGRIRLRPKRSALNRSAILTFSDNCYSILLCWLQLITV